jgi:Tfp pilus assembly pilus retraction ATPase PilT
MAKLDAYLRSIEKFGAAGAVLTSGQAVTLRFPSGDRNATQVTPHDLLVGMVRELAPPTALDALDANRPARFEIDSEGKRYGVSVAPRPGAWQVTIEPVAAPAVQPPPTTTAAFRFATPSAGVPAVADAGDMFIERGQYAEGPAAAVPTASGSTTLDQLTRSARQARATDIYLAPGSVPMHRVGGELVQGGAGTMEAEGISREIGVVATAEARAAWSETGIGTFTYSDGAGRIRVTLGRDQRGPNVALRLLPEEAPALERLNLGKVSEWLGGRGLVLVVGSAGAGKTVALAACVRSLGDRGKRVVTIEHPIEMHHGAPSISQRAVGEHVPSARVGVAAALSEGADAIVVGSVDSAESAAAVVDAVAGGGLVLATVNAQTGAAGLERVLGFLDTNQRDPARSVLSEALLGAVRVSVGRGGARSYETQPKAG